MLAGKATPGPTPDLSRLLALCWASTRTCLAGEARGPGPCTPVMEAEGGGFVGLVAPWPGHRCLGRCGFCCCCGSCLWGLGLGLGDGELEPDVGGSTHSSVFRSWERLVRRRGEACVRPPSPPGPSSPSPPSPPPPPTPPMPSSSSSSSSSPQRLSLLLRKSSRARIPRKLLALG